jgi:hypothetical protein
MTSQLEAMLFRKEYEHVQKELSNIRKETLSLNEQITYEMA